MSSCSSYRSFWESLTMWGSRLTFLFIQGFHPDTQHVTLGPHFKLMPLPYFPRHYKEISHQLVTHLLACMLGRHPTLVSTHIRVQNGLIGSLCCFWSPSSNCFFFSTDLVMVTLLYIWYLIGLFPLIDFNCQWSHTCRNFYGTSFTDLPFDELVDKFTRSIGTISSWEHVAFLLYWLCCHIFCLPITFVS